MATHELYLLHLGKMGLPDADTGETSYSPVPGYLIRTASGRTILVDTGNPVAVIGQPTAAPWWDHPNDTRPEDDLVSRLAELGITPGDVDLLISTHFDFDHCGRHDAFAGITSLVQQDHLDAARDNPRFDPALWDIPGITYTPADGDLELEPGLHLIASPGHVIGHQSVYVETADGPVLLAIDAISIPEQITMKRFPSTYPDPEAARHSKR